jgi:hypothetical protein
MNGEPAPVALPGTWVWPDGSAAAPPLGCETLGLQLQRLRLAAPDAAALARADGFGAFVQQRRPDDPVPLALADFAYTLADGAPRRAFAMAPLLHAPFGNGPAVLRGRVVRWWLDARFFVGAGAFPAALRLDPGDGLGPRAPGADGCVTAFYGADLPQAALVLSAGALTARAVIGFGTTAPPLPDETHALAGCTAWVFRSPRPGDERQRVIVCEGFPGGYACDWLHDMANQQGLLDAMRARGFDVVLLGLAHGLGRIDDNAAALRGAIAALDPVAVGGVSMGGLVARQALAQMARDGTPQRVALYFTVDTPHRGAYTPLSVQWFAHAYARRLGGAALSVALIDSVANQQFMSTWLRLHDGRWQAGESPERTAWLARLGDLGGQPTSVPRRLALACSRGDGTRRAAPGALQLQWDDGQGFAGALHALGGDGPVGQGTQAAVPPLPPPEGTPAWDGLPGSSNPYLALAAAMVAGEGLQPTLALPLNLAIPAASALDMDLPPGAAIPPDAPTPFTEWCCADADLPHLTITPALRDALLAALPQLPPAPAPAPPAPCP